MPNSKRNSNSTPQPESAPKKKANNTGMADVTVEFMYDREKNTSSHHTDEYENDVLVLRRGATFDLWLKFQGCRSTEIQESILRFVLEPKSKRNRQTVAFRCGKTSNNDISKWGMNVVKTDSKEHSILCQVNIPVHAAIGRYTIEVVVPKYSLQPLKQNGQIIVIFNPWNKDDQVYISEEDLRREYVLSDCGLVYAGWSRRYGPHPKKWNFGQFEPDVLDCVLYLLEKDERVSKKPLKALYIRKSAVWVARILSAMINSQDDDGVLVGNWTGDYEGGRAPGSWNGSVKILQDYYREKNPVKYGQCWVFSGVMTAALRAVGIPARSVTNYDSAHDTDQSMTIDKFIDEEGDKVEDLCNDSVWNFHVWNEIWTKREDLPGTKYDGWQAVDATPQELSSQLFQMGPAPLTAVKEGEIFAGFDTGFVFAEVNADCVTWLVKKDENDEYVFQKASKRNTNHVGKFISTKMVGMNRREDITNLYKYPEGSPEERKAFTTAYSFGEGAREWTGHLNVEEEGEDLIIELSTKEEDIHMGKPITCIIDVKNTSESRFSVDLTGVISSVKYTGDVKCLVKKQKFEGINVNAGKNVTKEITLEADEYLEKLVDLNCLKFVLVAKVLETRKIYVDEISFQVFNEDAIDVEFAKLPLQVGEEAEVMISFTNPLPIRLSYLRYSIEGAGLTDSETKRYRRSLKSGGKHSVKFQFSPRKPGNRTLLVDIDTTQAKDFKAAVDVEVLPREDKMDQ